MSEYFLKVQDADKGSWSMQFGRSFEGDELVNVLAIIVRHFCKGAETTLEHGARLLEEAADIVRNDEIKKVEIQ